MVVSVTQNFGPSTGTANVHTCDCRQSLGSRRIFNQHNQKVYKNKYNLSTACLAGSRNMCWPESEKIAFVAKTGELKRFLQNLV